MEGKCHGLFEGTIPKFLSWDGGKPRNSTVNTVDLRVKILTRDLPNTKQECQQLYRDFDDRNFIRRFGCREFGNGNRLSPLSKFFTRINKTILLVEIKTLLISTIYFYNSNYLVMLLYFPHVSTQQRLSNVQVKLQSTVRIENVYITQYLMQEQKKFLL